MNRLGARALPSLNTPARILRPEHTGAGVARILIVEDEDVMAEAIAVGLRRAGHAVDVSYDGADGLYKAQITAYDVLLLDRDLPGIPGDEVCRALQEGGSPTRILMLTAAGSVSDRVEGLQLGADDYLPKPFAFVELVARVEALARRGEVKVAPLVRVGDLVIDRARRLVTRGGTPIELTAKEFGVLEVLACAPGVVVSAEELLERVWDENADPFTNAVRVTMVGLRRKLGEPPLISTLRARGYRFDEPATSALEG